MRNYRNLLALAAVATSGALLSSCASNTTTAKNDQAATPATSGAHQHKDGEAHNHDEPHSHTKSQTTAQSADASHGSTVHTHSTKLQFSSVPATLQAAKPGTMTLQIVDKSSGAPINDYEVVHDKKLHFIVVSSDLSFFNHIHPQFVGNGKFQITTTLPRAGTYRLYADYKPQGEEGEVALHEVNVGGATNGSGASSSTRLAADTLRNGWMTKNVASHDEGVAAPKNAARYQVALMPMPSRIQAGKDVMLHFQVRDASGKPLSKLEPYLGAQGHCVILSSDPQTYLHTHPMDGAHDMGAHDMGAHDMGAMKMGAKSDNAKSDSTTKMSEENEGAKAKEKAGSDVMFHTNFPVAGLYKVWGQFKHNGKIISAPFVVNVGAKSGGESASATPITPTSSTRSSGEIPANAQEINISLPAGYKKGAATVQAGQPVALTFTLKSDAGCGNEIALPAAKWQKTLAVGQSATVVYTPAKSGTLAFACSMDMMRGSIVVR